MKKVIAFLLAALLGTGAGLVFSLAFQVTAVEDHSMLPTYELGQHVLVSKRAYTDGTAPGRSDVVLLPNRVYAATGEGGTMMKRIAAVAGDLVMIRDGIVFVNNQALEEDYVFTPGISGELEQVTVPADCVFVLGDNRAASTDSRSDTVGMVREEELLGKVIFKW